MSYSSPFTARVPTVGPHFPHDSHTLPLLVKVRKPFLEMWPRISYFSSRGSVFPFLFVKPVPLSYWVLQTTETFTPLSPVFPVLVFSMTFGPLPLRWPSPSWPNPRQSFLDSDSTVWVLQPHPSTLDPRYFELLTSRRGTAKRSWLV